MYSVCSNTVRSLTWIYLACSYITLRFNILTFVTSCSQQMSGHVFSSVAYKKSIELKITKINQKCPSKKTTLRHIKNTLTFSIV